MEDSEIGFELPPDVEEEGQIVKIVAYRENKLNQALYAIFSILTGGFFYLLCRWDLKLKIWATMSPTSIERASSLLIFCKGCLLFIRCFGKRFEDGTFELVALSNEKLTRSSFMADALNHKVLRGLAEFNSFSGDVPIQAVQVRVR